tara:strand:- start:14233 stop:14697 length:465 start_codon:yes stop_codon:yes gene_type:complete
MIIALNKTEQRLAQYIAKRRYEHDRSVNATATIYGNGTPEERELDSVAAEIAFCKHHNIWPDMDAEHFGLEDCLLANGKLVDVKTTRRENGRLMVKAIKRKEVCDLYALVVGRFPKFRFAGWMAVEELFTEDRLEYRLQYPSYVATQNELTTYI